MMVRYFVEAMRLSIRVPTRLNGAGLLGEYEPIPGEKLMEPVEVLDGVIAAMN